MTFNILTIRTEEFDDGSLYPVLGNEDNEIEIEQLDGDVKRINASAVASRTINAKGSLVVVAKADEVSARVFITEARVAVGCTKYDKGGGWVGGSLAVPVLNLASRARARHRRKGKMLVGHIRYQWLNEVGFTAKTGFLSSDCIRLGVVQKVDGAKRRVYLDITFPKRTDTAKMAQLIVQRAAAYRLRYETSFNDGEREALERLSNADLLQPQEKSYVFYNMPTYYNVSSASAYPSTPTAGT